MKPNKISFNNISVKNQQIKTNTIVKNNIEFLNDKSISDIYKNIPNKFIRFKIYENVLQIFRLNKCNILIKYHDKEILI